MLLDVHSEITRDENHNHHYANDVENIHSCSPRGSHLKKSARPGERAHYSAPVTGTPLHARPISGGISPVVIPAAIGPALLPAAIGPAPLLVAPIGFKMTDGTACTCAKETVSNEMPGDAADHRAFYAPGRLRRA